MCVFVCVSMCICVCMCVRACVHVSVCIHVIALQKFTLYAQIHIRIIIMLYWSKRWQEMQSWWIDNSYMVLSTILHNLHHWSDIKIYWVEKGYSISYQLTDRKSNPIIIYCWSNSLIEHTNVSVNQAECAL